VPSVLVDANVLVSAFTAGSRESVSRRAVGIARTRFTLCLSDAMEAEIRHVLARPKFRRYGATPETSALFVDGLVAAARRVEPTERVTDCRDPDDNMYLEAALACAAVVIVSGDPDLLVLRPWRGIEILSPAEFSERVGVGGGPGWSDVPAQGVQPGRPSLPEAERGFVPTPQATTIYTLVRAADWRAAEAAGAHRGSADDARDGFLHFSTAEQVRASAAKHRRGEPELLLVAADAAALGPALRWEPAAGGRRPGLFPHLYGPLPLSAVRSVTALPLGADGLHAFPPGIP
jgi:putative PIN family toxin of toxin-antitoxin system